MGHLESAHPLRNIERNDKGLDNVIDVTGMPQTAVVVGGSSDLAVAVLRKLGQRRLRAVVLAGPDDGRLSAAAEVVSSAGISDVSTMVFDVRDEGKSDRLVEDSASRLGSVDMVVVASGVLGSSELAELTSEGVLNDLTVNFTGPAAAVIAFVQLMRRQGYGRIIVFSSVAGVRVRRSNFVYGAAKAGLDGFCQGLSDALAGSGIDVMIVRPGFVHSKMTKGLRAAPFAVGVDEVADAVVRGLETGQRVVWCPKVLAVVFTGLRMLPQSVWRRLPM